MARGRSVLEGLSCPLAEESEFQKAMVLQQNLLSLFPCCLILHLSDTLSDTLQFPKHGLVWISLRVSNRKGN